MSRRSDADSRRAASFRRVVERAESVARQYDLGFIPIHDEHYEFVVPKARLERPPVQRFCAMLNDAPLQQALRALKFNI